MITLRAFFVFAGLMGLLAMQVGCSLGSPHEAKVALRLEPSDYQSLDSPPLTIERSWNSDRLWELDELSQNQRLTLLATLTGPGGGEDIHNITLDRRAVGRPMERVEGSGPPGAPVVLTIDQPGGSFTFTGAPTDDPRTWRTDSGICRVIFRQQMVSAAQRLDPQPTAAALLRAALIGAGAESLAGYAQLNPPPTLAEATRLSAENVSPADVDALGRAGYRFTVQEMITLRQNGVTVDEAVGFHEAGFELTSIDLLRLHEASVTPQYAADMRRLGIASNDHDLLILHKEGVTPDEVATFQEAGYDLTRDDLVLLHQRGVAADDALALRQAGYDFTIDELLKLRKWDVPAGFAVALMDEGFEPLTADQLVELRLRRVTPEMVQLVRQSRDGNYEALAVPSEPAPRQSRPYNDAELEALRKALEP